MAKRYKSVEAAELVPLESFQSNQASTGDEQYHPHVMTVSLASLLLLAWHFLQPTH